MPAERYRIHSPIMALFERDGRHIAETVPVGAIVEIDTDTFDYRRKISEPLAQADLVKHAHPVRVRVRCGEFLRAGDEKHDRDTQRRIMKSGDIEPGARLFRQR